MPDHSTATGHCLQCGAEATVKIKLGDDGSVCFWFDEKACGCEPDPWDAYYAWPGSHRSNDSE